MVRSRRTKIAPEDKLRAVLSVLAGEMSCRGPRRLGVAPDSVVNWKHQFLEAGFCLKAFVTGSWESCTAMAVKPTITACSRAVSGFPTHPRAAVVVWTPAVLP